MKNTSIKQILFLSATLLLTLGACGSGASSKTSSVLPSSEIPSSVDPSSVSSKEDPSSISPSSQAPVWHDYTRDGTVQLGLEYKDHSFWDDGLEKVTLKTCIDGDTAHFTTSTGDILKARFYGIDTPESTGQIQPWGKPASSFTKEKLQKAANNGTIVISSPRHDYGKPEPDTTGERYVSLVWISETKKNASLQDLYLLNLDIVQEGLSWVKALSKFPEYTNTFIAAENQAKQFKLCLHGDEPDPTFNYGGYEDVSLWDIKKEVVGCLEFNPIVGDGDFKGATNVTSWEDAKSLYSNETNVVAANPNMSGLTPDRVAFTTSKHDPSIEIEYAVEEELTADTYYTLSLSYYVVSSLGYADYSIDFGYEPSSEVYASKLKLEGFDVGVGYHNELSFQVYAEQLPTKLSFIADSEGSGSEHIIYFKSVTINRVNRFATTDHSKVRVQGTVAGYADNVLYLQNHFTEEESGVEGGVYAGLNIFTGMGAIPSKFTTKNAYLQVCGTCTDSENFGFQMSSASFPTVAYSENDAKVLIKPADNTDERKLVEFELTKEEFTEMISNKDYSYMYCAVKCVDELVCSSAYKSSGGDFTLRFDDTSLQAYITFPYTGDPENPSYVWSSTDEYEGKAFLLNGIYVPHKTTSGKMNFQINPTRTEDLVWVQE